MKKNWLDICFLATHTHTWDEKIVFLGLRSEFSRKKVCGWSRPTVTISVKRHCCLLFQMHFLALGAPQSERCLVPLYWRGSQTSMACISKTQPVPPKQARSINSTTVKRKNKIFFYFGMNCPFKPTFTCTEKPPPAHGHTSHILVGSAQNCQLGVLHKQQYLFSVHFSRCCVSKSIPSTISCRHHCVSMNRPSVSFSLRRWMSASLPYLCNWLLTLWQQLGKFGFHAPDWKLRKGTFRSHFHYLKETEGISVHLNSL